MSDEVPAGDRRRFCTSCGAPIGDAASFCPMCGAATPIASKQPESADAPPDDAGQRWSGAQDPAPIEGTTLLPPVVSAEPLPPAPPLDLRPAGLSLLAAVGTAALVTAVSWGLDLIGGQPAFLVRFADLSLATPVLIGVAAGVTAGSVKTNSRGTLAAAALSGAVAAGLLSVCAALATGQFATVMQSGFVGTIVNMSGQREGAMALLVVASTLLAALGWRASAQRRRIAAALVTVSSIALAIAIPMAVHLFELYKGLGWF